MSNSVVKSRVVMNRKERRKLAKQVGNPQNQQKASNLMAEGLALAQAGNPAEAVTSYEKARRLDATNTDIHYVLGVLNRQLGNPEKAIRHYRDAIKAEPANVNAYYNLGNILAERQQFEEAIKAYRQAVEINPNMALAWNNLGNILKRTGAISHAVDAYNQSLAVEPRNVDALFNLGELRRSQGLLADAITTFEQVLEMDARHLGALNNMGAALRDQKDYERSANCLRRAIQLAPEAPKGYLNLANTLHDLGAYDDGLKMYETALTLDPENPKTHTNFGNLLRDMMRFEDAGKSYQKALAYDPDFAEGHYNLGLFELLQGQYGSGWQHFNWRWQLSDFGDAMQSFAKPLWQGQSLENKTLLLWDEQGVGDSLLLTSIIPDLRAKKGRIKMHCDPRLIPLISRSFPGVECAPKGEGNLVEADQENYDFHAPVGNLGGICRTDSTMFTDQASFLVADLDTSHKLRQSYKTDQDPLLVGLAWHSKGPDSGPRKSIALMDLKPILEVPGVKFVNLQYGDTGQQRAQLKAETGIDIHHDEYVDQMCDIDLFAAQTKAMDLVVTISNTTAHMAGGLGVPTLLMLPQVPIWYWMMERDDNPWYPSMKLYRQTRSAEWAEVINRVAAELRVQVKTRAIS